MIDFDLQNNLVTSNEKLFQDEFGRLRNVQTGPEEFLYILISNQDGRGTPKTNDDEILRIMPIDAAVSNDSAVASKYYTLNEPNSVDFRESRGYVMELYAFAGLGLVGMIIVFIIIKKIKNKNTKEM